jgi:hypothetical protein
MYFSSVFLILFNCSFVASSSLLRINSLLTINTQQSTRQKIRNIISRMSVVPHGGELIDRMVKDDITKRQLIESAQKTVILNERQLCDVELLMEGGFSPLTGYMNEVALLESQH